MDFEKLLKELVDVNSHSGNIDGLKEVRKILEREFDYLKGLKKIVAGSVLYTKRPEAKTQIFLGGHFDTVYPLNSPFQKFSKPSKGIWMGPGVADMKGGLLILLASLIKFEQTAEAKNIGWRIVLNHDEEIGSLESTPLIKEAVTGAKAAFFFEPSFAGGELVSSRKGSLNLDVKSKGKSAHAGRDLTLGKNAILPLAELMCCLKDIAGLNFGSIHGGHAFNVVPDHAELKINYRAESESDFQKFFNRFEKQIEGQDIEWVCTSFRPPKPLTRETKNLLKLLNYPVETVPSGGVCDGNYTASLGIPTLDTLGAVGGKIHTHDEYIEAKSLEERSQWFLSFLTRLSTGEVTLC